MIKKLIISITTIFTALILVFFVVHAMPGNPLDVLTQQFMAQGIPYQAATVRAQNTLNFDPNLPLFEGFINYLGEVLTGNFGQSMTFRGSVVEIVLGALPWTLLICSIALFFSFIFGNALGLFIAWKRSKIFDGLSVWYQAVFGSLPDFIIAFILMAFLAVGLGWFPVRGAYSSGVVVGWNIPFIIDILHHAALPVLTFFLTTVGGWMIGMKAICMGILGEDYINYAKARGLSNRRMIFTYLGKNALIPQVTSLAITFGFMFGGSPLIENLFVYPGVGFFLSSAISRRDYPLMQGMFLMIIVMIIISGLVADYANKLLNPRLKR